MISRRSRLQNTVTVSTLTLPATLCIATTLWLIHSGGMPTAYLGGWLTVLLATYLLVELNNTHSLIRIRTRLTASVFIWGAGVCSFLHPFRPELLTVPALIGAYYLMFRTYQDPKATGPMFNMYLCLGIGTAVFPHLAVLLPLLFLLAAAFLRAASFATFRAALLGALTPYWLLAGYCFYTGDTAVLQSIGHRLVTWELPGTEEFAALGPLRIAAFALLFVQSVLAIGHFMRTSYNDKIRTRMLFYVITLVHLSLLVLLMAQPMHFDVWFALLLANASPLQAHLFALTHTRPTNLLFVFTLLLYAALIFIPGWML